MSAPLLPPRARLLRAAERWCGVPYGHPASRHDSSRIDCSTLTAHVLADVLPGGLSTVAWLDVVVADARRPWSPIDRAVRDGWGESLPDGATGPTWTGVYLLQAWREIPTDGHAMLVWALADPPMYRGGMPPITLAVLEATTGYGVRWRGARQRATAPLSLDDAPPLSVEALAEEYPAGVRWARLVGL